MCRKSLIQKFIVLFVILLMFSTTTLNAGFWSSVAGGVVANSMTGKGGGSDGSARSYFVILNKKVNLLDIEVKILLGSNVITLALLIWIIFRQKKYFLLGESLKKEIKELKNEKTN